MKYILSEDIVHLGKDFTIKNDTGEKVYIIDGKPFAFRKTFHFKDTKGTTLFKIKKKLISLTTTYRIIKDGKTYGKISKKLLTIFREKITIKTPYGDIIAKGDLLDYDFSFNFEGKKIGEVSKKWISIKDSYVLNIENFSDAPLLLACTVIIDTLCHNKEDEKKTKKDIK